MSEAHVLIAGKTMSGKSTLAKQLAESYNAQGIGVMVLDPIGAQDWPADYQTTVGTDFLHAAKQSWQCALFIDEAGAAVGRFNEPMQWCATQARHYAHRSHFITQRPAQLAVTVRDQCSRLLLFAVSARDAKNLYEEWGHDEILSAPELPPGQFLDIGRFSKPKLRFIF